MGLEIRLQTFLKNHGLDDPACLRELRNETKLDWHTLQDILNNRGNPSLETLWRLCEWLGHRAHLPSKALLADLLDVTPGGFLSAVTMPNRVAVYLGEQRFGSQESFTPWVSKRDAIISTLFLSRLWSHKPDFGASVRFVPFWAKLSTAGQLQEEIAWARAIYRDMRASSAQTSILVGSPQVNGLVELMLSDLFDCKPFVSPGDEHRLPLRMVHRPGRERRPSFLGGTTPLAGHKHLLPGTYFLNKHGRWIHCPFEERARDSGLVIVQRHSGNNAMLASVFGLSGWGTEAIGRELLNDVTSSQFWPPEVSWGAWKVGVYVCQFETEVRHQLEGSEDICGTQFKVTPLCEQVLREHLSKRRIVKR